VDHFADLRHQLPDHKHVLAVSLRATPMMPMMLSDDTVVVQSFLIMVRLVRDFLVQEHAKLVAEPMPPILSKLVALIIDKRSHSLSYVRVHFRL
jgi:hypothetical protein